MSLLRKIQSGATTQEVPLADLLRQCKVLATRLGHEPLAEWADRELNGYGNIDDLPAYRQHPAELYGNFVGAFQSQISNLALPSMSFEDKHRGILFKINHLHGVAHYESLLQSDKQSFTMPVSPNLVLYYRDKIVEDMFWVSGWNPISRGTFAGMLDQVRNRILSLALDVETEDPNAGDALVGGGSLIEDERVSQIFQTNIYGGPNVVASGSRNIVHDFENVAEGSTTELLSAMRALGVPEEEIRRLEDALTADVNDRSAPRQVGPHTQEWLARTSERITKGTLQLANGATGSVLGTLIMQFAGIV